MPVPRRHAAPELSRYVVGSAMPGRCQPGPAQDPGPGRGSGVELLDFEVAVMNLVSGDGDREVLSVAGPAEVREHLLGTTQSQCSWQQMLDADRPTGSLRFMHHDDADLLDEPARLAGARITNRKPHPRSTVNWG